MWIYDMVRIFIEWLREYLFMMILVFIFGYFFMIIFMIGSVLFFLFWMVNIILNLGYLSFIMFLRVLYKFWLSLYRGCMMVILGVDDIGSLERCEGIFGWVYCMCLNDKLDEYN